MARLRVSEHDGAVMSRGHLDRRGRRAADGDRLAPRLGRSPLPAELVAPAAVEALDEDVLIVGIRVGDAPRDGGVVAEVRESGNAGEGQPDGVEVRTREMV